MPRIEPDDELIQHIRRQMTADMEGGGDGYLTAREWRKRLGNMSAERWRTTVETLQAAGWAILVSKRPVMNLAGMTSRVPHYKLSPPHERGDEA